MNITQVLIAGGLYILAFTIAITIVAIVVPLIGWWLTTVEDFVWKHGPKSYRDYQRREWPYSSKAKDDKLGIEE